MADGTAPSRPAGSIDPVLAAGLGDPVMADVMSWERRIAAMVDVERALALSLGSVGLVSADDADAAAAACDVARLDLSGLAVEAAGAATPVIPLLAGLHAAADDGTTLAALHLGATSQDIIDTAVALQLGAAMDRLEQLLLRAARRCAELADLHRDDVMVGRTLGQQAVPVTFGLKAARWLAALDRRIVVLRRLREEHLLIQLGGAAGTSGSYGDAGLELAAELGRRLGLAVPTLPLHGERDHVADLAAGLAAAAGVAGAIASDVVLLAQTEVGEVGFRTGSGPTSSAMPHKRNPVDAVAARAAARLAASEAAGLLSATSDHELERSAGAWQAEWVAVPSLLVRTAGALLRAGDALEALVVDPVRMRANLAAGLGLAGAEALGHALSPSLGRRDAAALVTELSATAARTGRHLADVSVDDRRVTDAIGAEAVRAALDPSATLALVPDLIRRALDDHAAVLASSGEA